MKIYVSGPYSAPTEEERLANTERALEIGVKLMAIGHVPFIPHLSHYTDKMARKMGHQFGYEVWLDVQDKEWVKSCDALYYISPSKGADIELVWANEWHMPVYRSIEEVPTATGIVGHPRFYALLDETDPHFIKAVKTWIEKYSDIKVDGKKLHQFKARKYGADGDPLANIRSAAAMGYHPYDGCLIEINNIHSRLTNLVAGMKSGTDLSTIDEEPLRNALLDNAAWSYLAVIMLEEEGVL